MIVWGKLGHTCALVHLAINTIPIATHTAVGHAAGSGMQVCKVQAVEENYRGTSNDEAVEHATGSSNLGTVQPKLATLDPNRWRSVRVGCSVAGWQWHIIGQTDGDRRTGVGQGPEGHRCQSTHRWYTARSVIHAAAIATADATTIDAVTATNAIDATPVHHGAAVGNAIASGAAAAVATAHTAGIHLHTGVNHTVTAATTLTAHAPNRHPRETNISEGSTVRLAQASAPDNFAAKPAGILIARAGARLHRHQTFCASLSTIR
jgi:hypothetical protein